MECECSCQIKYGAQIGRLESLDVTTVELFHFIGFFRKLFSTVQFETSFSLSIFLLDDLIEMLYENFGWLDAEF